jgi:hypothetical protein
VRRRRRPWCRILNRLLHGAQRLARLGCGSGGGHVRRRFVRKTRCFGRRAFAAGALRKRGGLSSEQRGKLLRANGLRGELRGSLHPASAAHARQATRAPSAQARRIQERQDLALGGVATPQKPGASWDKAIAKLPARKSA